jgi:acyl-CoA reductase-like NAD-dependent aldehyde dehydrogenase
MPDSTTLTTATAPHPTSDSTVSDVDRACRRAATAAAVLAGQDPATRAAMLTAAADTLDAAGERIVALADRETRLGAGRLGGELARTTGQLRLFAAAAAEGSLLELTIDHADPHAAAPRPDLRRMMAPLGPVAVFAASNFPLAFSVAGGDTAAALAAGCPVVVKAHEGHPQTSQLVHDLLAPVLPAGALALLHGRAAGAALVKHPAVRAVGFTGSLAGGQALAELARARPDPIPFFGELGSVNPVVVTAAALHARGPQLAQDFVTSYTMGLGQFCTKPGILLLPAGHGLEPQLAAAVAAVPAGPLLGGWIRAGLDHSVATLAALPGVRAIVAPVAGDADHTAPALLAMPAARFLAEPDAAGECFGPISLLVEYDDEEQLIAALRATPGSLTVTVHAEPDETGLPARLLALAAERAGRVVWNGWPTGVAVGWATMHGGPWPASTDAAHTSVGVAAARRFLRPVSYQSVPDTLLPAALREANPLRLPRRVDGTMTLPPAAA